MLRYSREILISHRNCCKPLRRSQEQNQSAILSILRYIAGPQSDLRTRRGKKARAVRDVWVPREKFEIQGLMNVFLEHFPWHFFQKISLRQVRSSLFIAEQYWCQVNDHLHFKAFKCFNRYSNVKTESSVYGFYTIGNYEKSKDCFTMAQPAINQACRLGLTTFIFQQFSVKNKRRAKTSFTCTTVKREVYYSQSRSDSILIVQVLYYGRAWLAQLVRSLPSNHKVPGSIIGFAEIRIFVQLSFPPKPTQLSILPGQVNEDQLLLGANLRWISVPSRGSQRLSSA